VIRIATYSVHTCFDPRFSGLQNYDLERHCELSIYYVLIHLPPTTNTLPPSSDHDPVLFLYYTHTYLYCIYDIAANLCGKLLSFRKVIQDQRGNYGRDQKNNGKRGRGSKRACLIHYPSSA